MKRVLQHIGLVAGGLFLCLILPGLLFLPRGGDLDAVSGASMVLPDQPSGEFLVFINRDRHAGTLKEWEKFFLEQPVEVIMEDLSCLTVAGDAAGLQLARRYQARLAANQMKLRSENGLLAVSRAEHGLYDVLILSREAADAWDYSGVISRADSFVLAVEGGAS